MDVFVVTSHIESMDIAEGHDDAELVGVADSYDLACAAADDYLQYVLADDWDSDWEASGLNDPAAWFRHLKHEGFVTEQNPVRYFMIRRAALIRTWLDI